MADFSIASQIQPYKAPDMLGVAEHVQKMQTSNMLMQQRAAELQKENALRAAAAQYGVNSKAYAEAAGRIDPEAGLKAFTYQRQMQAAGASAAAAARAAELDRIRADTATVELVNKHGARFEQALRMVPVSENPAATYDKLYSLLPPTLKPLYPDKYSPDAVQRALMTNAEVVAAAAPKEPQYLMGPAGPIAIDKNLGGYKIVPEVGAPAAAPVVNNALAPPTADVGAPPAANALAPQLPLSPQSTNALMPSAATALSLPAPGAPAIGTPAQPPLTGLAAQRAQLAQERLAEKGAEKTQALEIDKRFSEAERSQARQEFDKTLANIVAQYKDLGEKGMLVKPGETTIVNRAKAAAATSAPGLTTVLSPERGEAVSTLANLRQTMLSALMGATGMSAKNIDSNAEMRAYLNSLSNPGQSVKTIVDTLNNLSERFGTNRKLKEEDITGGKPQNPPSGKVATPVNIHDAADAILRGGTK